MGRSSCWRRILKSEILENAFADCRRTFAPGGVQGSGFTRIAVMLGEYHGQPLAIFQALARHRRQKLYGRLRQNLSLAHLLLNRFRQSLHQQQSRDTQLTLRSNRCANSFRP